MTNTRSSDSTRVWSKRKSPAHAGLFGVGDPGFEPGTSALSARGSAIFPDLGGASSASLMISSPVAPATRLRCHGRRFTSCNPGGQALPHLSREALRRGAASRSPGRGAPAAYSSQEGLSARPRVPLGAHPGSSIREALHTRAPSRPCSNGRGACSRPRASGPCLAGTNRRCAGAYAA